MNLLTEANYRCTVYISPETSLGNFQHFMYTNRTNLQKNDTISGTKKNDY